MWDLIVSVPDHCLSFYFFSILVLTRNLAGRCRLPVPIGLTQCLSITSQIIANVTGICCSFSVGCS